jgi:hypothetical protein
MVCFSISSFDSRCGFDIGLWRLVEKAVGQRAANSFVEENKRRSGLIAVFGQAISVAFSVALHQAMVFELPNVVAKLGQRVIVSLEMGTSPRSLGECRRYEFTAGLPVEEKYNIASPLRRSAASVALNIAVALPPRASSWAASLVMPTVLSKKASRPLNFASGCIRHCTEIRSPI